MKKPTKKSAKKTVRKARKPKHNVCYVNDEGKTVVKVRTK